MKSIITPLSFVSFPEFSAERAYMVPFRKSEGLPNELSRWQETVDAMLDPIDAPGEIYIMIDQGIIEAGKTHRRGGPHIDGNWIPAVNGHGSGGHAPRPAHGALRFARWDAGNGDWNPPTTDGLWRAEDFAPELLVLASDVSACVAFEGEVDGHPKVGGDCSHLDLSGMRQVRLLPALAYAGNVTMIHESIPVAQTCRRTLVRLNIPGGVVRAA